jgi:catalase
MRPDELAELARRSLEEIDKDFGDYPGYRAAQAKGTLCRGMFTAGEHAGALTRALHFQPHAVTPVTARFSNFTANPMRRDGAVGWTPRPTSGKCLLFSLRVIGRPG